MTFRPDGEVIHLHWHWILLSAPCRSLTTSQSPAAERVPTGTRARHAMSASLSGQFTASEVGDANVHLGMGSTPGPESSPRLPWRRCGVAKSKERHIATGPGDHRVNERIRVETVRLIDNEGNQRGVMSSRDALALARSLDLDLVEIAPTANPPVCRIMDYGKFKFDEAQKAKESRRKTTNVGVKEMKYRPKIGPGDFDTKTRLVEKFLSDGHKVKITIMFRGRESAHPELGRKILDRIVERVGELARVESAPKIDGRNMIMVLGPEKRAKSKSGDVAKAAASMDGSGDPSRGSTEES